MREKIIGIFLSIILFLFQVSISFCKGIKFVKKIQIEEDALLLSGSFVVMEDGHFIFPDIKDKKSQIKVIDEKGKVIKAWGKWGPGPDEFQGLADIDYQNPYMAVKDAGKNCVHVFKVNQSYKFQKITDILAWEATGFIKLYKKKILLGGYIVSPEGKHYMIFGRDFHKHNTEYILPLEFTYGAKSLREHRIIRDRVAGFSYRRYGAISGDTLFYVSDVRLKVIKINLETKKIEILGKEPKNFHALVMNKKTRNELLRPQTATKIREKILNTFSFVSGIFAGKNFIGVIYVNREKKIENELYFVPYIQIYDHSGKLLYEGQLEELYLEDIGVPLFYQQKTGFLYLLAMTSTETRFIYTVYKYQIER